MNYEGILNQAIQSIAPSGIRKFFDLLEERRDAISLGIGEPDFQTPWHIRDAGIRSLEKGHTKYTSNAGMLSLRKEIQKYLKERFQLEYSGKDEILVTVGGSEAIDLALRVLLNPEDEVIIPTPSFVCYGPLTQISHGVPVYLQLKAENDFRLTAKELESAITEKTKVLILPFPSNPTGAIMNKEDLEAIAKVLSGTDIMVISDEIYNELTYEGNHVSLANIQDMRERTLIVGGFSKSFAMTGWRLGYLCAPAPLIAAVTKLHQFGIMSAPSTSQYAAVEALQFGEDDVREMREEYNIRREFLLEKLKELNLPCFTPKGAFYLFPDISKTGLDSATFCERFLLEENVAVIPGTAFGDGGENYVRICYASSQEDLQEAMKRLAHFLQQF
ncbi:MAG: aminotransferase class I/II-fold pyridoxal phosphate-dependent enzyme [Eubacteriales bacterium]